MQISKVDTNLLTHKFLQKKTGMGFPLIKIKIWKQGQYNSHLYISHIHKSNQGKKNYFFLHSTELRCKDNEIKVEI